MSGEPSTKRARTDAAIDNPYLAHLEDPRERMTGGAGAPAPGARPFDGWQPRTKGGKDVEAVMVRPSLSSPEVRVQASSRRAGAPRSARPAALPQRPAPTQPSEEL